MEDLAKGVCDLSSEVRSCGHSCGVIGTYEENKSCGVGQKVDIPFCIYTGWLGAAALGDVNPTGPIGKQIIES